MRWNRWTALGLAGALAAAGCSDGTGPNGGGLSQQQKDVLTSALINSGAVTGGFADFAAYAIDLTGEVGRLEPAASAAVRRAIHEAVALSVNGVAGASYDAVGFAIAYSWDVQNESFAGWTIGVIGWNGISTATNTVDELVFVGSAGDASPLPSSTSGLVEDGDVFAAYWDGEATFFGITGQADISGSSFTGDVQDCSSSTQDLTVSCSVQVGRMGGSFDFESENNLGTATYSQPGVTFSGLPAVRIVINVTG